MQSTDELIITLANRSGLGESYYDHRGELRQFSLAARRAILQAMGLPVDDPEALQAALAAVPPLQRASTAQSVPDVKRCFQPASLTGHKCWGISIQLYTLRSSRNWGIGDFADLHAAIERLAPLGCDLVGLNPLHALFTGAPEQCSPYSPSSRLFLNVLYIAVDIVPEFVQSQAAQALVQQPVMQNTLESLRASDNVLYQQVAAIKLPLLRLLYRHFCEHELSADTPRAAAFRAFVAARGDALRHHATFEALDHVMRSQTPPLYGWQQWPVEYGDPQSAAIQQFAQEHADEVEFHMYAQWLADEQLRAAQRRAHDLGMRIGLYCDLAVGANPDGSEVWSNRSAYVYGVSVGAPPDPLALNGQDWGIPPMHPHTLREQSWRPFVELIRANMRHAGAMRIDHVMSLFRLWWVPHGFSAVEGVYVHYPLQELIGVLAEESRRAHCLIVGEDLGTVPDEVRHAMSDYRLYHYKVLLFERYDDGRFTAPRDYVREAIATPTTHDLPPLKAWWQSDDIHLRATLGLYPHADIVQHLLEDREADRRRLMDALRAEQLWHWSAHEPLPEFSLPLTRAIHLYVGRSNAALTLLQLEDLIGMTDPVNVPGTHAEHANWQRKLTMDTTAILTDPSIVESLQALTQTRRAG